MENWPHLIFTAIAHNNLSDLQMLLHTQPNAIDVLDRNLNTPLLYACHLGHCHIVRYLLSVGANCGQLNIFGQNALTLATYSGNFDTCQTILRCVNFDVFNETGLLTPLCVAALKGYIDIAKIYVRLESSNPNRRNCPSETIHGVCPLRLAQINGDTSMIELLWPMHQSHLLRSNTH